MEPGARRLHPAAQPAGGIEADRTVSRLERDRFRIVTGTAFGCHDAAWIARHLPWDGSAWLEDVAAA